MYLKLLNSEIETFKEKMSRHLKVLQFVETHRNFIQSEPERLKTSHREKFFEQFSFCIQENRTAINTPIERVIITNVHYFKMVNHKIDKNRKEFIKHIRLSLEKPNEIWKNKDKHYYLKIFKNKRFVFHIVVVKTKEDGNFYVTNFPIAQVGNLERKMKELKKEGDQIYSIAL